MKLAEVSRYYTEKLGVHGASPEGVDRNGSESRRLKFDQLMHACESEQAFSVNEIGCGHGEFTIIVRTAPAT